jgi:formylglycine-generating enzyme required for sulfatase activity
MVMVCVPAGAFLMGSTDGDPYANDREQPQHAVHLDAFWIDEHEVTNTQYRKCVEAGACQEPGCWTDSRLSSPDQPVVCVAWDDAQAYAAWVGGRLPTEAEWEKAARGTDGQIYPWGDSPPDCYKANYWGCTGWPLSVGTHPDGASPYGALDMAGNVWEWVADWYSDDYYAWSLFRNPQGPDLGDSRVLRGGGFDNDEVGLRSAYRYSDLPDYWDYYIGLRVVVTPGTPSP